MSAKSGNGHSASGDMALDPYNLQRFIDAQASTYARVIVELCAGKKQSHWMWFIFPPIAGLGQSDISRKFSIASRAEAEAYLRHTILGSRLRGSTQLVLGVKDGTVHDIFGSPDDMKFHSSMTLFNAVAPNDVFKTALDKYFGGAPDSMTVERL
jgi:uncharacterized protein (DUF1810 family)